MDLRIHQWFMLAKRDGVCQETGKNIKEGDKILYLPPIPKLHINGRIFCESSKEYIRCSNDPARSGYKDNL